MTRFPAYRLSLASALLVIAGCGGNDVVRVDRNSTNAAPPASARTASSSLSSASSNWNDSRDNSSQSPAENNVTSVNSTGTIVGNAPLPTASTKPTDPANPAGSPTETAPPPSDFHVVFPEGHSIDIWKLIETECDDFESKLASIAEGKLMLRTYYTTELPAFPGQNGSTRPKEILIESPGQTAVDPAAPPQTAPNPYPPGTVRQPRGISRRGAASRFGGTQRPARRTQIVVDPNKPFLYIGRIAATLRGPTAAFYRDGTPMAYMTYDRDSLRDGTFICWDEKGRPVLIDQFSHGRRNGMRVLFRERSENDPTGRVALVQEWRGGKRNSTHLVAEHGGALAVSPVDPLPEESERELASAQQELDRFDEKLRENESELREAMTAFHREQLRLTKPGGSRYRAQVQKSQLQILSELESGIQPPGTWRRDFRLP